MSTLKLWIILVLALGLVGPLAPQQAPTPAHVGGPAAQPAEAYGRLPLAFEANRGQVDAQVRYLAHASGYLAYLLPAEAVLVFGQAQPATSQAELDTIRLQFVGANPAATASGRAQLQSVSHYLRGGASIRDVPHYQQVLYQQLYPGVDLLYYGNQSQLEYDFVVAPGADPRAIRLAFSGAERISLDAQGDLVLHTAVGEVRQHKPVIYQELDGVRIPVSGRYVQLGLDQVAVEVGSYDTRRPLVIDPVVSYASYLGGSGADRGYSVAVDGAGNAYLTGQTFSANFPLASALDASHGGSADIFVAKLSPAGSLIYSTYLGGSGSEEGRSIAVDAMGCAYVTGPTTSTNFPVVNALRATSGGGTDAFLLKLSVPGSSLVYSTYLGGSGSDVGSAIAVDSGANVYVAGQTTSTNFPVATPLQATSGGGTDAFVAKLNAAGSGLSYATYLGGSGSDVGYGIAVDGAGSAYVTGQTASSNFPRASAMQATYQGMQDAFVTKLNAAGSGLVYSTYLGGTSGDIGRAIVVDGAGSAYLTGETSSGDFPLASAAFSTYGGFYDAFVAKLNAAGSGLSYATFLGGSGSDYGTDIGLDGAGKAYVVGRTGSASFPTTQALQGYGGGGDAFVVTLSAAGSTLEFASHVGGSGADEGSAVAVSASGQIYLTGQTSSTNFMTKQPAQATAGGAGDAFIVKLSPPIYAVQVSAGENHTCALRNDGTISCWGANYPTYYNPPSGTFKQISAGYYHACALRTDNTIACWGQSGRGETSPPAGTYLQVSSGLHHSCGLRTDNTVLCWGFNNNLQTTMPSPAGTFKSIDDGRTHACGFRFDGSLACWGDNMHGQQMSGGPGAYTSIDANDTDTCAITASSTIQCVGLDWYTQLNTPSDTYTQLSAGAYHGCAIRTDKGITCWGYNHLGQATAPTGTFKQVSAGSWHTCAIRTDDKLICWGSNNDGQLAVPADL